MGILDRLDRLADQLGDLIGPDDVRAHVELGAGYLERGDYDSALHELEYVSVLRPDHPRALYLLGLVRARRGEEPEAVDALSRAIALREDFAEARLALAEVQRRRGQLDDAIENYRAALDRGPSDEGTRGELCRGLGAAYLQQGRLDKAVRELRKAAAGRSDDSEAQALLGRALQLRGDLDGARIALSRAVNVGLPEALPLAHLGEVYEKLGRLVEAEGHFDQALERAAKTPSRPDSIEASVTALLGLARVRLTTGRLDDARQALIDARALAPDRLDIELLEAKVLALTVSPSAALAVFDRILDGSAAAIQSAQGFPPRPGKLLIDRRAILREAVTLCLEASLAARGGGYAEALLADGAAPADEPEAWAARSLAALERGDLAGAEVASRRALEVGSVETHLAAAEVARVGGHDAEAVVQLRRAAILRPDDPRPARRLRELRTSTVGLPSDLYGLIQRAQRLFVEARELGELAPEAARVATVLDRPLLVTVMGEFNAGKSTFVNALLGEEVAPMGIVPTTATINILKYGSERKGRVVYLDDTAREVAWADVPGLLRGLDAAEAKRIRWVEVLYPLDTLQRVNVVDTPGLNSIHAEHEEVARRFIAEADAVIWLFSADQAAKATEGAALQQISSAGKKILGVLNKVDRCSPEELAQIIAHVQAELGPRLETIVAVSAKQALTARRSGDEALLAKSNYAALHKTLEERFFSRARALLKEAAISRLTALLARATTLASALLNGEKDAALRQAERATAADGARFAERFLASERLRLAEAAERVSLASATEVLDFVRPRSWAFGTHQAQPADRDFLVDLVEERAHAVLAESRARVMAEVAPALDRARTVGIEVDVGGLERLLDQEVYGRYRAFVRGYLRGGWVDEFFARRLPRVELNLRELRRALDRDAPWSDEWTSTELRAPLAAWSALLYAAVGRQIEEARSASHMERIDLEQRLLLPLDRLRHAVEGLQSAVASATTLPE